MPARKPLNLFSAGGNANMPYATERRALLRMCARSWWGFLTAKDVDGTPLIITQDEQDEDHPHKGFPTDKPYLKALGEELMAPLPQIKLVDKSRQMMVSTLCVLLIYWVIMFHKGRLCFISKQ